MKILCFEHPKSLDKYFSAQIFPRSTIYYKQKIPRCNTKSIIIYLSFQDWGKADRIYRQHNYLT